MNTKIDTDDWEFFKYKELFLIKKGKRLIKEHFTEGTTPFIGAIDSNNGYRDFIGQLPNHTGNTITVNYNGSVGEAFYQPDPFWASDDVNILYPKFDLNKYIALFIIPIIKKEIYRFNYGRKWETNRMNESLIKLPVKSNGKPDFDFMENYIKSLYCSFLIEESTLRKIKATFTNTNNVIIEERRKLEIENWYFFNLQDLFIITGSKSTSLLELNEYGVGKYPYITTKATNNGVDGFFDYWTEQGGVLTLDSAVIGYCSYQEHNFSASDHVEKLIPQFDMNKYIALFLTTIINKEQYRFGYGRKCSQSRLKQLTIKLPIKNNQPDWYFMENYIKSLPYSASI